MIEHLLDEALVSARSAAAQRAMTWKDVEHARLVEEVGTGAPVEYTEHERRLIATHEAGHATARLAHRPAAPARGADHRQAPRRRSACSPTATARTSSPARAPSCRRSCRSRWAASAPRSCSSATSPPAPAATCSTRPTAPPRWSARTAWTAASSSYLAVQNSGLTDTNIVGRVLADDQRPRRRSRRCCRRRSGGARACSATHRHLVEALRDALLEREELVGSEITDVLEAAAAAPPRHRPARGRAPVRLRRRGRVAGWRGARRPADPRPGPSGAPRRTPWCCC